MVTTKIVEIHGHQGKMTSISIQRIENIMLHNVVFVKFGDMHMFKVACSSNPRFPLGMHIHPNDIVGY